MEKQTERRPAGPFGDEPRAQSGGPRRALVQMLAGLPYAEQVALVSPTAPRSSLGPRPASRQPSSSSPGDQPVQLLRDHSSGTPVAVDLAMLSEPAVLNHLSTVEMFGAGRPSTSCFEYEADDEAALLALRAARTFGDVSSASLLGLLASPPAEIADEVVRRYMDAGTLATFAATFTRLRANPQIIGLGIWAASKSPIVVNLASGGDADLRAEAANQLLEAWNELREVELRLPDLRTGETFNLTEAAIAGTTQTADLSASTGRQIEVKTVREPILTNVQPITAQLHDGLAKFTNAPPTGGPYEVVVYASYQQTPTSSTSTRRGQEGTTTRSASPATGELVTGFSPTPPNRRPAGTARIDVEADLLGYLNGSNGSGGRSVVHGVIVRLENPDTGPQAFTFARGLGAVWARA